MPGLHSVAGIGLADASHVEARMTKDSKNPETVSTDRRSQLRKLLSRKNGATIAQIQTTFGWQPHSARAAISNLRKAGEQIDRQSTSKGSIYRIVSAVLESVDEH
jgi:isopropylmalate/homocitrate/citramalate synthase